MIELEEIECCILIDALNKKINSENDTNDYTSVMNKLQGESELKGYMDRCNVSMIIPKKKLFRDYLINTFDVTEAKIPELSYNPSSKDLDTTCIFPSEYLAILLELSKHSDEVKLSVKHQYPLTAETEDFKFILAPRVHND